MTTKKRTQIPDIKNVFQTHKIYHITSLASCHNNIFHIKIEQK